MSQFHSSYPVHAGVWQSVARVTGSPAWRGFKPPRGAWRVGCQRPLLRAQSRASPGMVGAPSVRGPWPPPGLSQGGRRTQAASLFSAGAGGKLSFLSARSAGACLEPRRGEGTCLCPDGALPPPLEPQAEPMGWTVRPCDSRTLELVCPLQDSAWWWQVFMGSEKGMLPCPIASCSTGTRGGPPEGEG